ncbi:MAG: hypothetical protein ACTHN8_16730 [Angustibacter sp.]
MTPASPPQPEVSSWTTGSRREFLDQVLLALYGEPPVPRGSTARAAPGSAFALLPGTSAPVLAVPTGPGRAAEAVVRNHTASAGASARVVHAAVRAIAGVGALRWWPHQLAVPSEPHEGSLLAYLREQLAQDVLVGVPTSAPRANRKPVIQLLTSDGRTFAFVKVGTTPLADALVRDEGRALGVLAGASLRRTRVPAPLHVGTWREHAVLVQSAVLGGRRTLLVDDVVASMVEVSAVGGTSAVAPAANAYVDGLRERLRAAATPRAQQLLGLLERWCGTRARASLRLGSWHGDWTPWNMSLLDGQALVWDWERFEGGVPLGFDALHYVVQSWLGPAGVDPLAAAQRLLAQAERVVAPFGVAGGRDVAQLYLLEIGARYETDRQEAAGARLGALQDWLLPALEASLDAPASPRRAPE